MESEILEMLTWPATPGRRRLTNAARALTPHIPPTPEPDPGYTAPSPDVEALGQYYATQSYQHWANRTFVLQQRDHPAQHLVLQTLRAIAHRGDTDHNFGMALATRPYHPRNTQLDYHFTRLHRNTDWMGFSLALPKVRGLTATIFESPLEPNTPGIVLATPDPNLSWQDDLDFPFGQPKLLRELLRWHGATKSYWVTTSPNHSDVAD